MRRWPKYGVEAELFQMNWGDKEPWAPKFERLLLRIDELLSAGKDVALVGASAGASAAINAGFSAGPLSRRGTTAETIAISAATTMASESSTLSPFV